MLRDLRVAFHMVVKNVLDREQNYTPEQFTRVHAAFNHLVSQVGAGTHPSLVKPPERTPEADFKKLLRGTGINHSLEHSWYVYCRKHPEAKEIKSAGKNPCLPRRWSHYS